MIYDWTIYDFGLNLLIYEFNDSIFNRNSSI